MNAATSPDRRALEGIEALVVGASAGGVEALMKVLPALDASATVSVLVVLHLPRGHPSSLADIFRAKCALPVREAEDKVPVAPGVVYVAPPDYHLLVDADSDQRPILALSADEPINYSRPSIDVLFESAADRYGPRLGGVILTGANPDGAAGLAAVKRAGGTTIVQSPASAMAPAMPIAAIARSTPDFVLDLDGIVALLRAWPSTTTRTSR